MWDSCYPVCVNNKPQPAPQPVSNPYKFGYAPIFEQLRGCAWVVTGYKRIERKAA